MPPPPVEKLRIKPEIDTRGFSRSAKRMGLDWSKEMGKAEKKARSFTKGAGKAIKEFYLKAYGQGRIYNKVLQDSVKEQKFFNKKVDDAIKKRYEQSAALARYKAALRTARTEEERAALGKKIAEAQKGISEYKGRVKKFKTPAEAAKAAEASIRKITAFDPVEVADAAERAGEEFGNFFAEPLKVVFSKDVPAMAKMAGNFFGKSLGAAGDMLAKRLEKAQMAGTGGGAMNKALGGLASALKAIGPIISMVGGLVSSLVQLFLDADAAAKDFNKEVMSTAGSAEFLYKNMHSSAAAGDDLRSTLKDMYTQATALDNIRWGITKEQYVATSNALTAEGVSLKKLSKEYQTTTGFAKTFGDTVKMGVAYSRAFGVSIQEIGQFEGEMMTELGMNLDQVESGFQYMIQGAEEAGIATNKFFSIIRGFSADLTLFTVRLESVTKVMMALGKAMSPRDAQKFLQGITGFFKGQGLGERTKHVLLAGGTAATQARLQKSMDEKLGSLAKDIAKETGTSMDTRTLKMLLKKSDKQLAEWIADNGVSEDTQKAIYEAARQQSKIVAGTPVDLASAIGNLDPFETMEQLQAESMRLFHKDFGQLTGVERLGAEQAIGISDEQQDQFAKLGMGVEQMRADLAHKLEKGLDLTDAERNAIEKLGVTADATGAKALREDFKAKDIWNAMSADQQKLLQDGSKQIDFQKQTADVTTSLNTKIEILVGFLMREFYQTIINIWEAIESIPGVGNDLARLQIQLAKSGNRELMDLAQSSKSVSDYQSKILKTGAAAAQEKALLDPSADKGIRSAVTKAIETSFDKAFAGSSFADIEKAAYSAADAIKGKDMLPPDTIREFATLAGSGHGVKYAIDKLHQEQKISDKQAYEILEKLRMEIGKKDPTAFAEMLKTAGAAAAPTATAAPPSAQAVASAKAAGIPPAQAAAAAAPVPAAAAPAARGAAMPAMPTGLPAGAMVPGAGEEVLDAFDAQQGTLDNIFKALRIRGVKLDKPFVENTLKKAQRDATYDAASEALADYYMLSKADSQEVQAAIKHGADPTKLGAALSRASRAGTTAGDYLKSVIEAPHQAGGVVTGVAGGRALVHPAPGEGLTSIGKGERIVPAGGGGGGQVIELRLKGDLARIIDARSHNAIAEHEKMKTRR